MSKKKTPDVKAEDFIPTSNPTIESTLEVQSHVVEFLIKKFPHYGNLPDLKIATSGSIGIDLYACNKEPIQLNTVGRRALIPTGIAIELPEGFEAQIRPRSGLAHKHGVTVLNSPGTIDSDYRGEIGVILVNLSNTTFTIQDGERIAQLVIAKHEQASWQEVSVLETTERGKGGFGSTGK